MRYGALLSFFLLIACSLAVRAAPLNGDAFEDWRIACSTAASGSQLRPCVMQQFVQRPDMPGPSLEVLIAVLKDGGAAVVILTLPLEIHLPSGAALAIDDSKRLGMIFHRCIPAGCQVQLPLTAELEAKMRRGHLAYVTFVDAFGDALEVPFSLLGFTAAIAALRS